MSLYERPRIVKFMETERELWLRGTMGRGTGVLFNEDRISTKKDEKGLEMESGDG